MTNEPKGKLPALTWEEIKRVHAGGVEYMLPSGVPCLLKAVDVGVFLSIGNFADALTPFVEQMISVYMKLVDPDKVQEQENAKPLQERMRDVYLFRLEFARHALVYPKIVENPDPNDPGQIAAEDLSFEDVHAVWRFLQEPLDKLARFRPQPEGDVDDLPDVEGVEPAAEPAPKPRSRSRKTDKPG